MSAQVHRAPRRRGLERRLGRDMAVLMRRVLRREVAGNCAVRFPRIRGERMSEVPLTAEQLERAIRWADEMVAEGHHGRCASRAGLECDCYFARSDYLAARLLVENDAQLMTERRVRRLLAEALGFPPAYTELIGHQLMAHVRAGVSA